MGKVDYNLEPVAYCTKCYSLNIRYDKDVDCEWCAECGCSDIAETSIEDWEKLYKNRYGRPYIKMNNDPKKSAIYNVPINDLKEIVFRHPYWKEIAKDLYPRFPDYFTRGDSVVLLFDKLFKDNRIDELRLTILKYNNI